MPSSGYVVRSWHESVVGFGPQGMPDGCSGAGSDVLEAVDLAGRLGFRKRRGPPTTAAFCGAASGTLITSIRQFESCSSKRGVSDPEGGMPAIALQVASSVVERTPPVPET